MDSFGLTALWRRMRGRPPGPPPAIASMVSVQGLGLGIFEDGRPFLTRAALVRLCGAAAVGRLSPIQARLGGSSQNVHPIDRRVAALVAAGRLEGPQRENGLGRLTGDDLARFVRVQVGDGSADAISGAWRRFHERITVVQNYVPAGRFTIPKEIADLGIALAMDGAAVPASAEPILLADQHWWDHWNANAFDTRFSERQIYLNAYPSYLPHGPAALQRPHSFPKEALGEFRAWILSSDVGARSGLDLRLARQSSWRWPLSVAELSIGANRASDTSGGSR